MNYMRAVKIINRLSIVFMIINFIAALRLSNGVNSLVFLWVCGFSFLIYVVGQKKKWVAVLIALLSALPLILSKSLDLFAMQTIAVLCGIYISYKEMANLDYESEIDAFKRGLIVCSIMFLLALMTASVKLFNNNSAQYILIYFISSVILLRTLRLLKYSKNNKGAEKINKKYSATMISLTAILSIEFVRDGIIKGINFILNIIIDLILKIFHSFFMAVAYVMVHIMDILAKHFHPDQGNEGNLFGKIAKKAPNKNPEKVKSIFQVLAENDYFITVLKIAILLLLTYLVIKFLKTYAVSRKENSGYTEESEFIKKEKDKSDGYFKKLKNLLKPKNPVEYIRYYYRKFMISSTNKGIKIENDDTTRDINKKASVKYKSSSLNSLRDVYLRARYREDECSKEDAKKVKEDYQNIVKQK